VTTTLALLQMRCGGSPAENMARAVGLAERAQQHGAQMVVLPELFRHPYFCQAEGDDTARRHAEPVPGPTTDALSALARRLGVVLFSGTVIEAGTDGRTYNTAAVLDADGRLLGCYRKSRIPMDEGFYEQSYFAPGDGRPGVFRTAFGAVGVGVCYDQWFPELARAATLAGAEVLVYPSAIGDIDHLRFRDESSWQRMWLNAHLGHAASNNVFVAAVNRVGHEGRVAFWGGSFVLDPSSRVLAQGGCAEEVVLASCDLGRVREVQEAWGFLRAHQAAVAQDTPNQALHLTAAQSGGRS
jgi:predicted amidohydrolase